MSASYVHPEENHLDWERPHDDWVNDEGKHWSGWKQDTETPTCAWCGDKVHWQETGEHLRVQHRKGRQGSIEVTLRVHKRYGVDYGKRYGTKTMFSSSYLTIDGARHAARVMTTRPTAKTEIRYVVVTISQDEKYMWRPDRGWFRMKPKTATTA